VVLGILGVEVPPQLAPEIRLAELIHRPERAR
jgi:hypothetical protein